MKVETPQILWHSSSDQEGKAAPLYSVSLLDDGPSPSPSPSPSDSDGGKSGGGPTSVGVAAAVLATAGNTPEVNLWRIRFRQRRNGGGGASGGRILQDSGRRVLPGGDGSDEEGGAATRVAHLLSLSRHHDRTVNCVRFSPDGARLAAAGDGGCVAVYSLPSPHKGAPGGVGVGVGGGRADAWSALRKESDLSAFLTSTPTSSSSAGGALLASRHAHADAMDLSWSPDSRRFAVACLDHAVSVFELSRKAGTAGGEERWNCVRTARDHVHYVQGVSYDPMGVYLASQGSDRTVRVWARKRPTAVDKAPAAAHPKAAVAAAEGKVDAAGAGIGPANDGARSAEGGDGGGDVDGGGRSGGGGDGDAEAAADRNALLRDALAGAKFELGKARTLKFRTCASFASSSDGGGGRDAATADKGDGNNGDGDKSPAATAAGGAGEASDGKGDTPAPAAPAVAPVAPAKPRRHCMYADESTVESFFRRLSWTSDGAFLVTPAALWHRDDDGGDADGGGGGGGEGGKEPTFATYLYARHRFDAPYRVLHGLEKPSVVVRPNPVPFRLPPPSPHRTSRRHHPLPYRSVFAVLTLDTVLIYDTHHSVPLCVARGLHYAGLTDAAWTSDGTALVVTSTDGYVSALTFERGELGEPYAAPRAALPRPRPAAIAPAVVGAAAAGGDADAAVEERGRGDAIGSGGGGGGGGVGADVAIASAPEDGAEEAPSREPPRPQQQPSQAKKEEREEEPPKKKKKRIQPILVTACS